ncbi:MAG: hypothetical protein JW803_08945 [Endomicrobiales bacterium]|nr:hypothetical protein [Endomicrobiales bacterium]
MNNKQRIAFSAVLLCGIVLAAGNAASQEMLSSSKSFSVLGAEKESIFSQIPSSYTATPSQFDVLVTSAAQDSNAPDSFSAGVSTGTAVQEGPAAVPPFEQAASSPAARSPSDVPAATPQLEAGSEYLDFVREKRFIYYSKDRWIRMRKVAEGEMSPYETRVSTVARPAPPPLPPGLAVELPYESQLSISGRKLIGVSFKVTKYDDEFDKQGVRKKTDSAVFDMQQELQVRIKGKVGRKITVNVDFDDTREDKRDISVVYKGDPDEVVQEAAFGDVTMTLPQTEFVGYSKQLFGVKVETKYKGMRSWGFFSRTKGFSEVKRFSGNTALERRLIMDTAYITYKYYSLKFNNDAVINGTVRVYRDDRNQTNNNINTSSNTIVETLTTPTTYFTGFFDLLVPGQDYSVDYDKGVIAFRNRLNPSYVVAIDYQRQDGTWLRDTGTRQCPKIIKDEYNNNAITRELKTFYNLGNVKIIRDNGRGNFILKVIDLNNNDPSEINPGGKPVPTYPENMTVDFEAGIFNFEPLTGKPLGDDLYTRNVHSYNILTEYNYRLKGGLPLGRTGIVPQSERVVVDGKLLKANEDYFIDYDIGRITFFDEDSITENSVIEVSYDYSPFGQVGGSTLVGLRSQLSLTNNIFIGSSFIYEFAARTQTVPDIRTTPTSLMVWEADATVQDVNIPGTPLLFTVSGEYAQSERNPNITSGGKAVVESMEGIKQEDSASIHYESWKPAANPSGQKFYLADLYWKNEEVSSKDINPSLKLETDEKQQVLSIAYDLARSNELSLVQTLSNSGIDYSKKLYLEMWIYGDNRGEELLVSYGTFNENTDGTNVTGVPKTEDTNNDGTLNEGEDIGWQFTNPDGTTSRLGGENSRIDSQDLDANGILNSFDIIAPGCPFGPATSNGASDIDGVFHNCIDWTGWKYFRIPVSVTQPDEWSAIKQVRITIKGAASQKGVIQIANVSLVNNRWENSGTLLAGSTISISAISNETDADYARNSLVSNPEYQDFYEIQSDENLDERKEQALQLKYEVANSTGDALAAKLQFGRAYDLSKYRQFRFFLYAKNASAGDTFFIQAGNDANYFEYSFKIDRTEGWQVVTIYQYDLHKHDKKPDLKPEIWAVDEDGSLTKGNVAASIVGQPSLLNVSQLKVGVRTDSAKTGEVWINEIHVQDTYVKVGNAWRGNIDLKLPGWSDVGVRRKEIDPNFETFTPGSENNRDYLEDSAYWNFNRLSFMPFGTELRRTRTITQSVINLQNNLISIQEEGRVLNYTGLGQTSLRLHRYLPVFSGQYNRSITDTHQIQRLEDRETLSGTMDYQNPVRFALFPTNFGGNYSVTNSFYRIYPSTANEIFDRDNFLDVETFRRYIDYGAEHGYRTLEVSETFGARTPFVFWHGFTFNPTYNLTTVKETNKDLPKEKEEYPKSMSQDVGASSSLLIFRWLQPNFSYNINGKENYNLVYDTKAAEPTYPSETKYIERSSNGEVSWNFQVKDMFNYKYVQSLGFQSSLRIQDSDSYDRVDASSATVMGFSNLWIRDSLLLPEPLAGTTAQYVVKSVVKRDDIRVAGRYKPFEAFDIYGRLSPIKTVSTNFTYTNNEEDSKQQGTRKFTRTRIWPDLNFEIGRIEEMTYLERWVSESQMNLRHSFKKTLVEHYSEDRTINYGGDLRFSLFRKLDMNFSVNQSNSDSKDLDQNLITSEGVSNSWSGQSGFYLGKWRFTVRYENAKSFTEDGTKKPTADTVTDTYTTQIYSDMSFPRGLPIPFTKKTLPLTNRLIFNSNLKYATKQSTLNIERDNTVNWGMNTSAEYEVSQNFRLSVGVGYNRYEYPKNPLENYSVIEASSRLTIQF